MIREWSYGTVGFKPTGVSSVLTHRSRWVGGDDAKGEGKQKLAQGFLSLAPILHFPSIRESCCADLISVHVRWWQVGKSEGWTKSLGWNFMSHKTFARPILRRAVLVAKSGGLSCLVLLSYALRFSAPGWSWSKSRGVDVGTLWYKRDIKTVNLQISWL